MRVFKSRVLPIALPLAALKPSLSLISEQIALSITYSLAACGIETHF